MKESTYISARGYAMRLFKLFVAGCVVYTIYSIATCGKNTGEEQESKRADETKAYTEIEKRVETAPSTTPNATQQKKGAEQKEEYTLNDKIKGLSDKVGDNINYAIDNVTDSVSTHIKQKADDATKPYIEPWKELGAEAGRYGRALRNDYLDGKLLRN
ncbi:hypothetical protein HY636_03920 [Candidatus Woesearchaeota archaeon]|nr:hypothetical protein [Candidatus Woesearchaeota archaeon]